MHENPTLNDGAVGEENRQPLVCVFEACRDDRCPLYTIAIDKTSFVRENPNISIFFRNGLHIQYTYFKKYCYIALIRTRNKALQLVVLCNPVATRTGN